MTFRSFSFFLLFFLIKKFLYYICHDNIRMLCICSAPQFLFVLVCFSFLVPFR
ncbi:membrane protein [Bathymodiolus azoricus thioautotrophic gill symbiont]|uniref:Membrane protein n=1 Tax=Bathymodiolus azoricus thioautotrophic gill symbiont TaxID=235205 RepID=A0A1H6K0Y7_9GAMM|nr:membrane protein [Bathymodiolus azoricus thioautotrophic gill symbiont]